MVFSMVLEVIRFYFPWALAGLYLLAQHPPRGKLTFLVTFLRPDSQAPLHTNFTVSCLASNTWKSHYFSVSKSSQGPETVSPILPCEASRCQSNSAPWLHPVQCLILQKTRARLWGFIYTSFLKVFNTYNKYTNGSSVPLLLSGLKSSKFF